MTQKGNYAGVLSSGSKKFYIKRLVQHFPTRQQKLSTYIHSEVSVRKGHLAPPWRKVDILRLNMDSSISLYRFSFNWLISAQYNHTIY